MIAPAAPARVAHSALIRARHQEIDMRSFSPLLAAALLVLGSAAHAQAPPPPKPSDEGHTLALGLCSVCHIAASDQVGTPVMTNPGPPFRTIANRPGVDAAYLREFLLSTHSTTTPPFTMPNPELSDHQTNAVVSYILSLRGQP
jgi:mono/diheme cytochrome c family protein